MQAHTSFDEVESCRSLERAPEGASGGAKADEMTLEQQPVEYQLAGVRARKGSGITAVFDNPIQRSKRAKNSLALSKLPVGHLAVVHASGRKRMAERQQT